MGTQQGLSCLSCGKSMAQRNEHGVTIDYCPNCGGVWLDPGELESLTGSHGGTYHRENEHDDEADEDAEDEGILSTIAGALGGRNDGGKETS